MREFLTAIVVELIVGTTILISILIAVIWRKVERRIDGNEMAAGEAQKTADSLKIQVAKLETWKEEHANSDVAIHGRLEVAIERQIEEVGMFRSESAEQAKATLNAIGESSKEGRSGRTKIHEELNLVSGKVERWIGVQEERERRERN